MDVLYFHSFLSGAELQLPGSPALGTVPSAVTEREIEWEKGETEEAEGMETQSRSVTVSTVLFCSLSSFSLLFVLVKSKQKTDITKVLVCLDLFYSQVEKRRAAKKTLDMF